MQVPVEATADSLSAMLLEELRNQIIGGEFPPGMRLRERDLAQDFQVSRIPLREALQQLEAEGFIETLPRRGATVRRLTMRDAEELFEVRLGVEVLAARKAAERVRAGASPEQVRNAMVATEVALAHGGPTDIAETAAQLHEAIVTLGGNALLSGMMKTVAMRDRWIFKMASDTEPAIACEEHQRLCAAIYAGDADLTAAIAYTHIERARQAAMPVLQKLLPAPSGE
jgi:DNA-binding GntR family transcriptional regulator